MDPISLTASIIAFVTFGTELCRGAIKIHQSLDGVLGEHRSLEAVVSEMERFADRLLPPPDLRSREELGGLYDLAIRCRNLSIELRGLLRRIQPKAPGKARAVWSSFMILWNKNNMDDLENQLDSCRRQLEMQLNFVATWVHSFCSLSLLTCPARNMPADSPWKHPAAKRTPYWKSS